MSSKSKRRVTVDTGNTVSEDSEKRKPSVFERLGPGAGQRKYSEYDSEVWFCLLGLIICRCLFLLSLHSEVNMGNLELRDLNLMKLVFIILL